MKINNKVAPSPICPAHFFTAVIIVACGFIINFKITNDLASCAILTEKHNSNYINLYFLTLIY